jgi:hypothetical protein
VNSSTGTEASIRSGDVFDYDGLFKRASYPLGKESPDGIKGAARRERHDHGDRPRWIGLRSRDAEKCRSGCCGPGELQERSAWKFHGLPLTAQNYCNYRASDGCSGGGL